MESKKINSKVLDKKDFVHADAVRAVKIWEVVHQSIGEPYEHLYIDNEIIVHEWENGSVSISTNNDFINMEKDVFEIFLKFILEGR